MNEQTTDIWKYVESTVKGTQHTYKYEYSSIDGWFYVYSGIC